MNTLLSVDPSSTVTGWAVFEDGKWIAAGRIKAPASLPAIERIWHICDEFIPSDQDEAIIEISSGHTSARHAGKGAGLAVYGMAVGAIAATLRQKCKALHTVEENVWTRGVSKRKRAEMIALEFPAYDMSKDPGLDIADAIGLGAWWLREQKVKELAR